MSSGEAHVAAFLVALEQRFRAPPSERHVLFVDDEGLLCLRIAARTPMTSIVLQDGDFAKPIETLVNEVGELLARAAAVKLGAEEFNAAQGG